LSCDLPKRAGAVAKRKKVYERLHPGTKHGAVGRGRKKSQNENSFVDDTAKKSGKSRATVARDAARGKRVKVLDQIVGTCLDRGARGAHRTNRFQKKVDVRARTSTKTSNKIATDFKLGQGAALRHGTNLFQKKSRCTGTDIYKNSEKIGDERLDEGKAGREGR
jgi:hypothetical protein